MPMYNKRCPYCGKWFKALNKRRIYHDDKCKYEASKLRKRKPTIIIYCLNCGKPKETSRRHTKYCNTSCKNEYNHKKQIKTEVCLYCGDLFETTKKQRKYCDNNFCYYEAKRLRERKRYSELQNKN